MKRLFKTMLGIGAVAACAMAGGSSSVLAADLAMAPASAQVDPDNLKKEIDRLKSEKDLEAKRADEMALEREQFVKEIRRVENLNAKYSKELDDVRSKMTDQQQSFEDRLHKMESQLKESDELKVKTVARESPVPPGVAMTEVEKQANNVLMKGGDLDPEDEKFKEELARAHYNMGNVYFERGEYQRAVVEYYQAVDLMPYDADAHYNLAFVSGEYIGDQETALKHYQWYLYLKPNTDDRKFVEEKIVAAKITLRGQLDSKIEKSELLGQTNVAR